MELRQQAAEHALSNLIAHSLFQQSQHIACYFSRPDEFSCDLIIKKIWAEKKSCYLPVLSQEKENKLHFVSYEQNSLLVLNRFQIFEPAHSVFFPPEKLDLVLLPLVAFDLQGNRLGMGCGYYDSTFSFLLKSPQKKPFLLGLAFELQQIDQLEPNEWDVPLNGILTEKKLFFFRHPVE